MHLMQLGILLAGIGFIFICAVRGTRELIEFTQHMSLRKKLRDKKEKDYV